MARGLRAEFALCVVYLHAPSERIGCRPYGCTHLDRCAGDIRIAKDTNPSFLKDYPFEIGKTWGKCCVRLYTNKECSKTFKEVKIKESNEKENKTSKKDKKEQSIIKDNLYLYSINEKGEFGSNGSIGMAQAQLLEDLSKQAKFVQSEGENIISLKVAYPEKIDNKIIFVGKVYE